MATFAEEEGKTYEDAVEKALRRLAIEPEQADIKILEEGSRGVFNIGGRPWRVRVSLIWDEGATERLVSGLLSNMGVEGSVEVEKRLEQGKEMYFVNISTSGLDGLLIGKYGKTLEALQHLIARMVNQARPRTKVVVDVGGYKERQHDMLRKKAFGLAEKVKETRREVVMEPLRPSERRVVHLALAEDPAVRTYTVGDGSERSVVVAPNVLRETPVQPEREIDEQGDDSSHIHPSRGGGNRDSQAEWREGL